jgi:folate-binding protein YgfZ
MRDPIAGFGADVELQTYPPGSIVQTYGAPQAEYAAIRKAAGMLDANHRGVLELTGKDRHAFLNNFLTNQLWSKETKQGMLPGRGVYAFLLNGKGRVVADMNVLETGTAVWLETDVRLVGLLRAALEKYVFTEQVKFAVPALAELQLHGPGAGALLAQAGAALPEGQLGSTQAHVFDVPVTLFRDDACGVPGYGVLVQVARVAELWRKLADPYEAVTNKRPLRPIGWAMFNATRIEAGRPLYGIDFTDESLPAETGAFERAVSVTKGCYLGQEIVARMHARQQVARLLVGLRVTDGLPTAGAHVLDAAGAIVGTVTSSTLSPVLGAACLALATIKKGFNAPGTQLTVPAEGSMRAAVVTPLPFLPVAPSAGSAAGPSEAAAPV